VTTDSGTPATPEHTDAQRLRGDEGGLTVEMALLTPLLFLLLAGVFEFGLAWRDSLSISNATRAGARAASSAGDASTADHQALSTLTAGLEGLPETEIDYVIIYDAGAADGEVPAACKARGATTNAINGIPNQCNIYGGDWLRDTFDPFDTTLFEGQVGSPSNPQCASGRADWSFCPLRRESSQRAAGGPDYVGVFVKTTHGYVTKVFGSGGMDMEDSAVMRIEPKWGN
jgi:hypothetical protein